MRLVALLLLAAPLAAQTIRKREPSPKARGEMYRWTTKGNLDYVYRVPRSYDTKKGVTLLILLLGKDSTANTPVSIGEARDRKDRDHDLLLHPGGHKIISAYGTGTLEYKPDEQLMIRIRDLHRDFLRRFKVNATVLWGQYDGSAFAAYYAGHNPALVQGVVAEYAQFWKETPFSAGQKHQALHFTVWRGASKHPIGKAEAALARYRKLGLETVRLWRRWGAGKDAHAGAAAAWCIGMTTADRPRLAAAFDEVVREYNDYAVAYALARRVLAQKDTARRDRARAERVAKGIERLAELHAQEVRRERGKKDKLGPWVAHARALLDGFKGVPAREALARDWASDLAQHEQRARLHLAAYEKVRGKSPREAFSLAVRMVEDAPLSTAPLNHPVVTDMAIWRPKAGAFRLQRADLEPWDRWLAAQRNGWNDFAKLNNKNRPK